VLSCKDEDPPDNDPPQPHQSTITAFGKTATVTGDASISTADFNTAVGNLQSVLTTMTDDSNISTNRKGDLAKMMDRGITITNSNSAPASVNGALTVGAGHLINNLSEVYGEIVVLAMSGVFADPTPNPVTITQANGLAFDGKVTIKTGDPYTVADWNALVANVITAFNAAYTDPTAPAPVKGQFETVFANDAGAQIVLVNNLTNNWEVRDNEFKTLYLKTDSIATVVYRNAVQRMLQSSPSVGKATPAKHSVFLA
jgi:hypothetical protein